MDMTDDERITKLAELVAKLNEHVASIREALLLIRKIMDLQEQRLANLEDFMHKMTGGKPNPNVGAAPSE